MFRADRIVLAAGGLLARATLGFIALTMIIGWNTAPPPQAATASSPADDPTQTAMTVMLRVPEGALAKHLTVLDASGRELATLTHWVSGMTTVVSSRTDGAAVCYHLYNDGSAKLRVHGQAQVTLIDAKHDGMTQVRQHDVPPCLDPRNL